MVRSTLLPNRLWGATLENRGVLHSVWPGPLWTDFSPIKRTFQKSFGDGILMIFDDLSHGVYDFFVEGSERWKFLNIWAILWIIMIENTKMSIKKPRKQNETKIYAKIRPHANFQVNLSTRKKSYATSKISHFCEIKNARNIGFPRTLVRQ